MASAQVTCTKDSYYLFTDYMEETKVEGIFKPYKYTSMQQPYKGLIRTERNGCQCVHHMFPGSFTSLCQSSQGERHRQFMKAVYPAMAL